MKTFYSILLMLALIPALSAQETYTVTSDSFTTVENPYGDIIGWADYPYAGDFDSPIDAVYYEDVITVPVGTQLTSLQLNVTDFNCIDSQYNYTLNEDTLGNVIDTTWHSAYRTTFSGIFWGVGCDLCNFTDNGLMPGIVIFNEEAEYMYLRRDALADKIENFNGIWGFSTPLPSGTYTIRVIHDEPDNLGALDPDETYAITTGGIHIRNLFTSTSLSIAQPYTDGPEIEISEIEYSLEYTTFDWDLSTPVEFCKGSSVSVEAPYNENLNYSWMSFFGAQSNSLSPSASPNVVEISESIPFFSVIDYYTLTVTSPLGEVLMTQQFEVNVLPVPVLEYEVEYESGGTGECLYLFQVHVEDALGFVEDDFVWTVAPGYDNLNFGISDTSVVGPSIYFCFNPNPSSSDSIAEFSVTATNSFGCTTQENKYVVIEDGIPVIKTLTDTTDTGVSIEEILTAHEVLVYPNPAQDQITIEHDLKNAAMQIFNTNGVLVKEETVNGTPHLTQINDLPPGVYFITMRNETGRVVWVKKLVRR